MNFMPTRINLVFLLCLFLSISNLAAAPSNAITNQFLIEVYTKKIGGRGPAGYHHSGRIKVDDNGTLILKAGFDTHDYTTFYLFNRQLIATSRDRDSESVGGKVNLMLDKGQGFEWKTFQNGDGATIITPVSGARIVDCLPGGVVDGIAFSLTNGRTRQCCPSDQLVEIYLQVIKV